MAYNPYSEVNAIYNLKGQWAKANNSNDTKAKNEAASKAQAYYDKLKNSGYADLANELAASNYEQAKNINDKWAKTNKTKTRDYMYSLGKAYGMSSGDVDKLIEWDNQTGEVSFGGKKIGTPDTVVDGVSYWGDTSKLDNAFKDYTKRTNTNLSNSALSSKNSTEINEKINQLWGFRANDNSDMNSKYSNLFDYANSDVTKSDEYQSAFENIMPSYTLAAMQGRDNVIASNASNNSGNIDSYAAANALRQQAALTAKGQTLAHQAGLEAYQARIQNARNILSDLGAYKENNYTGMQNIIGLQQNEAQRLFENDETSKTNEFNREAQKAEITGYIPQTWADSDNQFLNADGTLKEVDGIDYQAIINNAQAAYEKTGDTRYQKTINDAMAARAKKVLEHFDKYGQFAESLVMPTQTETAAVRTANEDRKSAERMNADNNSTIRHQSDNATALGKYQSDNDVTLGKYQSDNDNAIRKYEADKNFELGTHQLDNIAKSTEPSLSASQAATAIKNGEISQNVIDAYNYYYGTNYTVDNPPQFGGVKGSKKMSDWVTWANGRKNNFSYDESTGELKYIGDGSYDTQVQLVKAALNDTNLSDAEKKQVVSLFDAAVLEEALRMIQVGR